MPRTVIRTCLLLPTLGLCLLACAEDDGPSASGDTEAPQDSDQDAPVPLTAQEAGPVVDNYAAVVHATYQDAITSAAALQEAVLDFTADPSEATMQRAKDAWLAAREPYGQTESFRFYGGPIDDADGPEGQINAWPMDEAYVDYVEGMPDAGIVGDPSIDITTDALVGLNEVGGEENVATGYHAIEFLLWGQDLDDAGPGTRSFEDFLEPTANHDRRALYLETTAALLLEDLETVAAQWDPSSTGNYRASFVALDPEEAVQNIMRGIGALAAAELAEERVNVALQTKLQEDEHSCFSDNTHNDILYNFESIKNVYEGDYGAIQGPGIDTLVAARDPELAAEIDAKIAETQTAIRAIPVPFDQAILGDGAEIEAVVENLRDLGELIVRAAMAMDITLNTTLE